MRVMGIDPGSVCTGYGIIEEEDEDHDECLNDEFDTIGASPPGSVSLSNQAAYQLIAEQGGVGGCPSANSYCVKSIGIFKEARRAVRVAR